MGYSRRMNRDATGAQSVFMRVCVRRVQMAVCLILRWCDGSNTQGMRHQTKALVTGRLTLGSLL